MHRDPHASRVPSRATLSKSGVTNHRRKGKGNTKEILKKKAVDKVELSGYQDEKEERE